MVTGSRIWISSTDEVFLEEEGGEKGEGEGRDPLLTTDPCHRDPARGNETGVECFRNHPTPRGDPESKKQTVYPPSRLTKTSWTGRPGRKPRIILCERTWVRRF